MSEPSLFLTRVLDVLREAGCRTAFHDRGEDISYHAAFGILRRLHAALGAVDVRAKDVVAIAGGNRPETILVQLAAQLRGARVLHLPASSSLPALRAALSAAQARVLVIDPDLEQPQLRELLRTPSTVLSLGPLPSSDAADLLASRPETAEPAIPTVVRTIFPSGGSTGNPKLIEHSGIYPGMAHIFPPSREEPDRVLLVAPMSHLTGNCTVLGALLRGDTVVVHKEFDADAVLRSIESDRVRTVSLTPPRLADILDHPRLPHTDLTSLRSLSLGASPLPTRRLQQALDVFGPIVGQGYGLTEAPMIASIDAAELDGHPERLGSVGRIVPGMQARIDPDNDEVLVRGLSMMDGYWAQQEHTASAFDGGWLHTGDVGRFDADGYLYLLDRLHDVIVTGEHGSKVRASMLDDVLTDHPMVREAAVFGVPGRCGEDELVHAVVVPTQPDAVSIADIRQHVRQVLGKEHFVPSGVDIVARLPRTPVGKVDKPALRAPFWRGR